MKKYKKFLIILIIFLVLILCNVGYYFIANFKTIFRTKTASSLINNTKTYSNSKIGFELQYPISWIVGENGNTVEINPPSKGGNKYFSVALRDEFKSLDEVKGRLATDIVITPVDINGASGFKYSDTDYHDSIWLSQSNKIYIIRVYPMSQEANQILSTLKFNT